MAPSIVCSFSPQGLKCSQYFSEKRPQCMWPTMQKSTQSSGGWHFCFGARYWLMDAQGCQLVHQMARILSFDEQWAVKNAAGFQATLSVVLKKNCFQKTLSVCHARRHGVLESALQPQNSFGVGQASGCTALHAWAWAELWRTPTGPWPGSCEPVDLPSLLSFKWQLGEMICVRCNRTRVFGQNPDS